MIIRPILSFEAVRRHAAHGNALFEARRCGTCEPRRIELRCRHGNMESQWYLERHVVHYADAPGKFHALYSHYTFPGQVESRSRGNYTLLLLVYHGERGEKGIGEGTDCFNFHVLPRSTTWHYCSYILFQIIFFTLSLSFASLVFLHVPYTRLKRWLRLHIRAFARWYNYTSRTNATTGKIVSRDLLYRRKTGRPNSMYHGQIVSSYNSLFGTWDARIPVLPMRRDIFVRSIAPWTDALEIHSRLSFSLLSLLRTTERYVMVYVTAVKILSIKRERWYREGVGIEVS